MVVDFGSGLYQLQLGIITKGHPAIQLPLQQKCDHKPVNANQPVSVILQIQQINSNQYRKRHLHPNVHILEHHENQFQVHVLQLQYL